MSEARVAGSVERLPWLADEPRRPPKGAKRRDLAGWLVAFVLLVAGASFWLGTRSEVSETPRTEQFGRSATVGVPEPRPAQPQVRIAPQPQVTPLQEPEIRQTPIPQVRIAPPAARRIVTQEVAKQVAPEAPPPTQAPSAEEKQAPAPATEPKATPPAQLTPWPPRVVAGAAGRLVEIGAFGSVPQAKLGWRYMVRAYPAVAHLPAVVRPDRNSKGRAFYRFRVGTTSQAHSEVLCQRMQKIGLSCAVVGLPWKAKVER